MTFEEWHKAHWHWWSGATSEEQARRAWNDARGDLKPLAAQAAVALEETVIRRDVYLGRYTDLIDNLRKAGQ